MKHVQEVLVGATPPTRFDSVLSAEAIERIQNLAVRLREDLSDRVIWNVNSTAGGGGVAEMLHTLLSYVRGLGLDGRWLVIGGNPDFFRVTKRLHHSLHGEQGDGSDLGESARAIYEKTMRDNVGEVAAKVRPRDIVILHDPQTAGLVPDLAAKGAIVIWRCHIGDDRPSPEAERGWRFLAPYLPPAQAYVFSRKAYVPDLCDHGKSAIVPPSIDPFSPKNCDIDEEAVRAILVKAGLIGGDAGPGGPVFTRSEGSSARVQREAEVLRSGPPPAWEEPLVVQISRWDPLKDPAGVMEGFCRLGNGSLPAGAHLILAGPDVRSVTDDPEGVQVFEQVAERWRALPEDLRRRIHLANLPMEDMQENAIIVNALQRHAAVVVQKSLREGFGLTVTEAMWKARPVIASAVGGIQDQVEPGRSGLLLEDPSDLDTFARNLELVLLDPELAARLGRQARTRVLDHYLGLRSLAQYAELIQRLDAASRPSG